MIVVSNDGQAGAPPPGSEITATNGVPLPQIVKSGTLDYRDYKTDQRVILPTVLDASAGGENGASLAFTFDDGPSKTVRSTEVWRLSDHKDQLLVDGDTLDIVERRGGTLAGDLTLVADGKGEENGHTVEVRMILTRRGAELSAVRLTRNPGEAYLLRHGYSLRFAGG